MAYVEALLRGQTYLRTITLTNAPEARTQANNYRFMPWILEVTYETQVAPFAHKSVHAKISGPSVREDGSLSTTWMSRRFVSELAIKNFGEWLYKIVCDFRPAD